MRHTRFTGAGFEFRDAAVRAGSARDWSAALLLAAGLLASIPLPAARGEGEAKPAADASRQPAPAQNAALAERLKQALEEGFVVGPKRLQEAQKQLAQARRLAPDDPRIDYALGLVLVKQAQVKQAIVQFETAVERDGNRFWPAWQALIWSQLSEKRYEQGLKQLVEFAGIVRQAEQADEISEAQREAARWIGQIVVAVSFADDSKRSDEVLAVHINEVLNAIGDDLWDELENGRDAITAREFAIGQSLGKARQNAEKNERVRKDRKNAQLEKGIEGAGKAKEDNEKSKEEWKTWLDDTLAGADKELGRLERDYKFLDQRAQSLQQSITLAGQELTAMELLISSVNPRTANPLAMQNSQQQYLQRQNQYLSYQLDYNATVGRMSEVAQAGAQTTQQRADAVRRYERETGELVKKNAGLDRWAARLKNEKQKLAVQKPAGKGPKAAAADKKVQPSFKTIFPLDFAQERERLLASFSPPSKPANSKDGGDQ
ncbi:MAG: tetratricopeptide repeat protein [Planctomycetia bacterium]|nr:tetratricopeptide repeat protein [Planctomycetia bacterium]